MATSASAPRGQQLNSALLILAGGGNQTIINLANEQAEGAGVGGNILWVNHNFGYELQQGSISVTSLDSSGNNFYMGFGLRTSGTVISDKMVINNGNVGIGTTGPLTKLYIKSEANVAYPNPGLAAFSGLHLAPTTDGYTTGITFGGRESGSYDTKTMAGIFVQQSGGYGHKMYFATTNDWSIGAQTRMMIDHTGNVGIGTTGPSYALDVKPGTSNPAIRIGSYGIMENVVSNQVMFGRNAYYNGSSWNYINSDYAMAIRMNNDF